jgi:hypothetical protein
MKNTESLKNTVSSISDEELRAKVEAVMYALGIPPQALGHKFSDMSVIRNTVMNMSESDFRNIVSALGDEKAQSILRNINKK